MKYKKIAIIHDVFIEWGGAERVLFSLLRLFPDADIYIPLMTSDARSALLTMTSGKIHTSFFNKIPFVSSASILLKPFLYLYWENLDLKKYDLVITSSHSFSSKSVITSPDTIHLSYIHTPPRYLYSEFNETRVIKFPIFKFLLAPMMSWLRTQDFIGAQRPDIIVANSELVKKRIQKYYRRDSEVIYPSIQLVNKTIKKSEVKKEYFLCFSRLAKQKGIDLAIKTCNQLKLPLLVVGKGRQENELKSIAGSTITFCGYVPDDKLEFIFSKAFALINCAREEDFGLVNIESLSYGVPIIGFNSGGIAEIVKNRKIGVLFNEFSVQSVCDAIKKFQKMNFSAQDCIREASNYSESIFHKKILKLLA